MGDGQRNKHWYGHKVCPDHTHLSCIQVCVWRVVSRDRLYSEELLQAHSGMLIRADFRVYEICMNASNLWSCQSSVHFLNSWLNAINCTQLTEFQCTNWNVTQLLSPIVYLHTWSVYLICGLHAKYTKLYSLSYNLFDVYYLTRRGKHSLPHYY